MTIESFDIINLFPVISMVFMLILGFFIIKKNYISSLHRLFFFITVVFSIWMFGTFMMFVNTSDEKIIFWDRFIYLGVVFMPALQYHFSLAVTRITAKRRILLWTAYVFSFLFLLASRTDLFVNDIFRYRWGVHSEAQVLHHFFMAFFFFYIFALLYNFYIRFRTSKITTEKYRLIYLATSFAVLNLVGGLGYLPAYKISIFSPISLTAPLFFSIITAYAIIRHRLMDVKLVMRKSSVHIFSLAAVMSVAVILKYIFDPYVPYVRLLNIVILALGVLVYSSINDYFFRVANKYFFTSLYDTRELISRISDSLRSTLETDSIYNSIYKILGDAFHFKAFGVLSYDKEKNDYKIEYNRGFYLGNRVRFEGNETLHKQFVTKNEPIVVEEIEKMFSQKQVGKIVKLLKGLKIEVLMPLNAKDKTVGLLVFGPKETGDIYNDEDFRILEIVGAQAAIAIENAWLFEEAKNFNYKLKEEVEKATRDLKQANEKLRRLDAAKSEFISIASHQLRTPLTVIKGYVSMVLEGSFGKISKQQHDALGKVYESSERLIQLIENLLNISRIESGRLQYSFQPVDFGKMVENVAEELESVAGKKGLRLIYKKPKEKIPEISLDEEKIRQAVMNLIDNSIKYTKKGSVTVSLKREKGRVVFCVQDTGMGISQEEMENLFKKFSRGSGTSLIHTEGTGLGLYVAKQIVKGHGGEIWAESKGESKGSKFCFSLQIKGKESN